MDVFFDWIFFILLLLFFLKPALPLVGAGRVSFLSPLITDYTRCCAAAAAAAEARCPWECWSVCPLIVMML